MNPPRLLLSRLTFAPAPPADAARGLLGFVSFLVSGSLLVDGVAVRRTRDRRLSLSFPIRHGRDGRQHQVLRPAGAAAREAIEREVFAQIRDQLAALQLTEEQGPAS